MPRGSQAAITNQQSGAWNGLSVFGAVFILDFYSSGFSAGQKEKPSSVPSSTSSPAIPSAIAMAS